MENFRERAFHLNICAKELDCYLESVIADPYLTKFNYDCKFIIDSVSKDLQTLLDRLENENHSILEKLQNTFIWQERLNCYSKALRSIERAVGQRLISTTYYKHFFPEYVFGAYHPRISDAIDVLLRHLLHMFFPTNSIDKIDAGSTVAKIVPIVFFGDIPSYEIEITELLFLENQSTILAWANIPRIDAYRYRFLSSLCHEVSHIKLKYTVQSPKKMNQSSEHSVESSKMELPFLYFPYPEKGQELYDRILSKLGFDLGVAYKESNLYSKKYLKQSEDFAKYISKQIDEIIADVASVIVFGLADLFTLICSSGNPFHGIVKDLPTDHPPLTSRVKYMLDYLKKLKEQGPLFKATLAEIDQNWKHVVNDITLPDVSEYVEFTNRYNQAVSRNFQDLQNFASNYLLQSPQIFKPKVWDDIITMIGFQESKFSSSEDIDPITCIIRAWAKRWVVYKHLQDHKKADFGWFINHHRTETKIFGQTINELNQW